MEFLLKGKWNMIIGLTGSSGSGKSIAAEFFAKKGFFIIDFDRISREICNPGEPCLIELTEHFGCDIIDDKGELARKKLGDMVFADKEKLALLNTITHKYILQKSALLKEQNRHKNIIMDAPLLFEAGLEKQCDYVVSILADREIQIKRIIARDGISRDTALGRVASQHSREYFEHKSDFCIYNNSTRQEFENKLEKLLEDINAGHS